jgi:hypothetical protein
MSGTQVSGLYGGGGQMDKFLYRQEIKGLCQSDRMIRSGSMRKLYLYLMTLHHLLLVKSLIQSGQKILHRIGFAQKIHNA